jgi:hypothetical protein
MHISNVLQPEVINCLDDSCDEENDDMSTKYKIVSQEEMQKIAARPWLLPYYHMVRWALDHVDLLTRTIFNEQREAVGSFLPENLQAMYKLSPTPNHIYNTEFLEEFKKKECE